MKAISGPLQALLDSGDDFVMADLWTITLNGGHIERWTSADKELVWGGHPFALGPGIKGSRIVERIGLQVANMSVEITADANDLVNGVPLIPFIKNHGLDGALIKRERAFMPDWESAIVGTIIRFGGRVTSVGDVSGSTAQLKVASWAALLNVQMPCDLYQAACRNSVYDTNCGLNQAVFAITGAVTGSPTRQSFASTAIATNSDLALGKVKFTSGPNTGIIRTVRGNIGGTITLVRALPAQPAAGDTFIAYPGCDRTSARCSNRFNNLLRFRGEEFVPQPETPL